MPQQETLEQENELGCFSYNALFVAADIVLAGTEHPRGKSGKTSQRTKQAVLEGPGDLPAGLRTLAECC